MLRYFWHSASLYGVCGRICRQCSTIILLLTRSMRKTPRREIRQAMHACKSSTDIDTYHEAVVQTVTVVVVVVVAVVQ